MFKPVDARHEIKTKSETPTVASVLEAIAADPSIPKKRRADICSGARSLCRVLGVEVQDAPLDPRFFGDCLTKLTPAGAKMSKGRLRNCKSHMDTVLAYANALGQRRRNNDPIAPAYKTLLEHVSDGWKSKRMGRFFRVASSWGVSPIEVNDSVFDDFQASLKRSTVKDYRKIDRGTRKLWNELACTVAIWPQTIITVPSYTDHYSLPEEDFPDSLWEDLDAYIDYRLKKSKDVDAILSDEDLLSDIRSKIRVPKSIKESTAKLIRYRVRQFASVLVNEGIAEANSIVGLKDLVAPKSVRDGLMFFLHRAGGNSKNAQMHGIANDLRMIARYWVKSDENDLRRLDSICNNVRPIHHGLPESARRSLAPLKDPDNVRTFLGLPDRVAAEIEKIEEPTRIDANRMATTLWIKLAQRAPLRISTLLGTELEKNIFRSHNGKNASVSLYFPADKVKNKKPLEIPLPPSTVRFLDLYLKKYRPLLTDHPSPWLFPAPDGGQKRANVMATDIEKLMLRYLGFYLNPHSFRHVAAKLYLSANPGRFVDVQLLLGHKRLETTLKYYCDLEAEEVFKHFDEILLKLENGGKDV